MFELRDLGAFPAWIRGGAGAADGEVLHPRHREFERGIWTSRAELNGQVPSYV